MAIKDSIVNLKKGLRTTLTNVPALIDTLVRGLNGVEEAAEEQTTYSANEHVIGKWIDGSAIYEKVLTFTEPITCPSNTWTDIGATIENINQVIEGIGIDGKYCHMYIGISSADNKIRVNQTRTGTNITISNLIIRYTKTSASRSPENDTKNGGDEEKNNEEVKNER